MPKKYPVKFYWKNVGKPGRTNKWRLWSKDGYGDHSSSVTLSTKNGFELYIPNPAHLSFFTAKQLKHKLDLKAYEEIWSRSKLSQFENIQLGTKWKKKVLTALNGLMKERF